MWLLIAQLTGRELKDDLEPMSNGATECITPTVHDNINDRLLD